MTRKYRQANPRILNDDGILITFAEAARITGANDMTIWKWHQDGKVKSLDDIRYKISPEGKAESRRMQCMGRPTSLKEKLTFNRSITCYRKNSNGIMSERCNMYWELTECFGTNEDPPQLCSEAFKDECPNFTGEFIKPALFDPSTVVVFA